MISYSQIRSENCQQLAHTAGKFFFMDTRKYEKSENFERNRAIFVLCTVDNTPVDFVALNFNLDIEEIKKIVELHQTYEEQMK